MSNRRRIIIIFLSVGVGSLVSLWILQKKMGTLSRENYIQLGINFFFAAVIVIGIAILLQKNNDKFKKDSK